ncbi:MAG: DUF2796 domain-containing protein [Oceanospirillaceae bacterium]|jgi:hypothetical protein|nr:DUF2796 domain-containing protein [Oceanospirillaceae bacterium]
MKNSNSMTLALASLMLTLPSVHANASELDAHEHGSANLDIAIDTSTIEMRFESPAVNIVGFEYATEDEQQLLLINKAKSNLSNFDLIYGLVGDVSCQTVKSSAKWVTEHEAGHDDHDDHEAGHDDHDDHEAGHDDHDDHEAGHDDHDDHEAGHDDHDDHEAGHDDHGEVAKAEHAEFIAEYRLECNQLNNLAAIDVKMFEFFPAIEDLDVQVVYSQGQIKYELDANNTLIKLDR